MRRSIRREARRSTSPARDQGRHVAQRDLQPGNQEGGVVVGMGVPGALDHERDALRLGRAVQPPAITRPGLIGSGRCRRAPPAIRIFTASTWNWAASITASTRTPSAPRASPRSPPSRPTSSPSIFGGEARTMRSDRDVDPWPPLRQGCPARRHRPVEDRRSSPWQGRPGRDRAHVHRRRHHRDHWG